MTCARRFALPTMALLAIGLVPVRPPRNLRSRASISPAVSVLMARIPSRRRDRTARRFVYRDMGVGSIGR